MSRIIFLLLFLLPAQQALAQLPNTPALPGQPTTLSNAPQMDTTRRTNSPDWHDATVLISYRKAQSNTEYLPDTGIHTFHRRPFVQDWYRDLGNLGSAVYNNFFTPDEQGKTGPRLGYNVYDVYRLKADSLNYYNTTRAWSQFDYQLGSQLEQTASILHTQNIRPNWNFAFQYRKTTSPGFYKIQRTNHDNTSLSTHYTSPGQHYELFGAIVYNRIQQDENGGIVADSFLNSDTYSDRKTIPVNFQNDFYSVNRSRVTNVMRDWNVLINHSYTLGRTDTLYNSDSTEYRIELKPRFSVGHRLSIGDEKHSFKNLRADSLAWSSFFNTHLLATDSVVTYQERNWVDNYFSLNTFIGKTRDLLLSAGIGNQVDHFSTRFTGGDEKNSVISNYLGADIRKDADSSGQWFYHADGKFYFTGDYLGNFQVSADAGKNISNFGSVSLSFSQTLRDAAYNFQVYRNQYFQEYNDLKAESITRLSVTADITRWQLQAGLNNYILGNYTYMGSANGEVTNGHLLVAQADAFNLTQIWLRKSFHFGKWVFDNELVYQQKTGNEAVNIPALMGRHQLSFESYVFQKALKTATGIELRYQTAYDANGYSPFYNRFYYQSNYELGMVPEFSVFFNFKIKRFRAYLMGDMLQTFWTTPSFAAPAYPKQNFMIRFGFDWALLN